MCESQTSIELPVFDISQPLSPSSLSSLSQACKEWGFFHITNHGVPKDLCRKLNSLSDLIFSLPSEVKLKAGPFSDIKTYTQRFIASPFFESLRVSGPDFFASAQISSEVLLGHPNSEFSNSLQEYGGKMTDLSKKIIGSILVCLGADFGKKFGSEFKNCEGYFRINHYTPPESTKGEIVEGLGMHTDMSCITVVYQDENGGPQVRSREGKWMDIDPREDTLVVNVGDLLHAWSNGKLKSSEHRVVLRESANRFSIAFFWCFEDEKTVIAPEEVAGEGDLRIYKPFVCADYMKFRESSETGKFEKVGYTIKHFALLQGNQG